MNLIEAEVLEIMEVKEITYFQHLFPEIQSVWCIKCLVTSYGRDSITEQYFSSKEEAESLKPGDTVLI